MNKLRLKYLNNLANLSRSIKSLISNIIKARRTEVI